MNNQPFQKFLELVTFDQQLVQLHKQIVTVNQAITALAQQVDLIGKETEIARRHWQAMRRDVESKELEMQEMVDSEKKLQAKLEGIQNPKEYAPLKKELDGIRARQHEFETTLIKTWQMAETAEKDLQALQAINEEKAKTFEDQAVQKTKELEELKKKNEALHIEREAKLPGIPQEWLNKYVMMQSRVSNPVVPVVNGNCGGCNFQVGSQDFAVLRKNGLVQCKECYRFMYLPEIMKPAQPETPTT